MSAPQVCERSPIWPPPLPELQAAFEAARKPHWPDNLAECLAHPEFRARIRLQAHLRRNGIKAAPPQPPTGPIYRREPAPHAAAKTPQPASAGVDRKRAAAGDFDD